MTQGIVKIILKIEFKATLPTVVDHTKKTHIQHYLKTIQLNMFH